MITGPKKLVKRAKFFAELFNIKPTVKFDWSTDEHVSECIEYTDGTFKVLVQDWLEPHDLITTIAHEMVHVWQYHRGDLKSYEKEELYFWKGKLYKHTDDTEEYFLRPWEMEARAYETYCEWKWRHR